MSIVTIGGIPVYDALILDGDSGMLKISLVDDPAVMSNFQSFDSQKQMVMYAVADEEKRLVRGVIMRADFPIYRRDSKMGEYYIIYKADTIRQMAEKYLVENRQNNINLMHEEDSDVDGVQMVQFFIKDSEKGVSPADFDEIADGSLFGEFHVTNDEVWDEIKNGTYKGFSLEGIFDLAPEEDKDEIQEIVDTLKGKFNRIFNNKSNSKNMSKLSRLKTALVKAFAEFGNITTDKGILAWDGDDDLKAGDAVYIEDSEGNRTPAEDGDYKTEDNKTIVVVDGKVSEIKDSDAQVASDGEEMASIETDNGTLSYEGELEVGTEVFVEGEDGNVPAPDGEYKADGKTIKVADGKVTEIVEDSAAPAVEENEVKAKAVAKFAKIRQAYSESYTEKESKMYDAINAAYPESYPWIVDAGDDYCVADMYDEESQSFKLYRFSVTWSEDGSCILGDKEEVKWQIVPADAKSAWDAPSEEEFNALKDENESLKAEVEKLRKTPLAKPAHEEVQTFSIQEKTGDRKLDRLAAKAALAREFREQRMGK